MEENSEELPAEPMEVVPEEVVVPLADDVPAEMPSADPEVETEPGSVDLAHAPLEAQVVVVEATGALGEACVPEELLVEAFEPVEAGLELAQQELEKDADGDASANESAPGDVPMEASESSGFAALDGEAVGEAAMEPPIVVQMEVKEEFAASKAAPLPRIPSNPKPHPALPRPPSQPSRPIFQIIAPRSMAPETRSSSARLRHFVPRSSADGPRIIRTFEPRRYSAPRMDKPTVSIARTRVPTSVLKVVPVSQAASKIPVKTVTKTVSLHQLPGTSSASPANSVVSGGGAASLRPPKPAASVPLATSAAGPTVKVLRVQKSMTPQPTNTTPPTTTVATTRRRAKKEAAPVVPKMEEEPASKRSRSTTAEPEPAAAVPPAEPSKDDSAEPGAKIRKRGAVEYLQDIKARFDKDTYERFLDIMKNFKGYKPDKKPVDSAIAIDLIHQICFLFASDISILVGFTTFLPNGYTVDLNIPRVVVKDPVGDSYVIDISGDRNVPPVYIPNPNAIREELPAQSPQPYQVVPEPLEETIPPDTIIALFQLVKARISEERYNRFRDVFMNAANGHNGVIDVRRLVLEASQVLESEFDLLVDMCKLLPDLVPVCEYQLSQRAAFEAALRQRDFFDHVRESFERGEPMSDYRVSQLWQQHMQDFDDPSPPISPPPDEEVAFAVPALKRPIRNLVQILKCSMTDDMILFNKIREGVGDDQIFDNFVRCLRLYSNNLITREELLTITLPFFRGLPLLQREFTRLMGFAEGYVHYPNHISRDVEMPGMNSGSVAVDMKSELDFTTLKRNGRSYRLLPIRYRHPRCSGRTNLCHEVLNDDWAIFPSWQSEETTRVSFKKSSFEEFLHRTEDERFEIDILLQVNAEAMVALERIRMYASQDPRYEVDDAYECSSKVLMARAVRRAYGEHTNRVLRAMRTNPLVVSTTVYNRLKQKEREWKSMESAFKLVWEDQARKHYQKMTSIRIGKVKRRDNRILRGDIILARIQKCWKRWQSERLSGRMLDDSANLPRIWFYFKIDWEVVRDVNELLFTYIRKTNTFAPEEKDKVKLFLRRILPSLLDYSPSADPEEFKGGKRPIPPNRPAGLAPRFFLGGDSLVVFLYHFQIVCLRLTRLSQRSKEYLREEAFKFDMIQLRQQAFQEAVEQLPVQAERQWDVSDGWDRIVPQKKRSLNRYRSYLSDLKLLITGKMTLPAFEEAAKHWFESDCYSVLGVDKFITTMAKTVQEITSSSKYEKFLTELYPRHRTMSRTEEKELWRDYNVVREELWTKDNVYVIEVVDEGEVKMAVRLLTYAEPDGIASEQRQGDPDWKVYRQMYRDPNVVQRARQKSTKDPFSRFRARPFFLVRNIRKGRERLGAGHYKLTPSSSEDEQQSQKESSDEDSTASSCDEMYLEKPYVGLSQPPLDALDDDDDELFAPYQPQTVAAKTSKPPARVSKDKGAEEMEVESRSASDVSTNQGSGATEDDRDTDSVAWDNSTGRTVFEEDKSTQTSGFGPFKESQHTQTLSEQELAALHQRVVAQRLFAVHKSGPRSSQERRDLAVSQRPERAPQAVFDAPVALATAINNVVFKQKALASHVGPQVLSYDKTMRFDECEEVLQEHGSYSPTEELRDDLNDCLHYQDKLEKRLRCDDVLTHLRRAQRADAEASSSGSSAPKQLYRTLMSKRIKAEDPPSDADGFLETLTETVRRGAVDPREIMFVDNGGEELEEYEDADDEDDDEAEDEDESSEDGENESYDDEEELEDEEEFSEEEEQETEFESMEREKTAAELEAEARQNAITDHIIRVAVKETLRLRRLKQQASRDAPSPVSRVPISGMMQRQLNVMSTRQLVQTLRTLTPEPADVPGPSTAEPQAVMEDEDAYDDMYDSAEDYGDESDYEDEGELFEDEEGTSGLEYEDDDDEEDEDEVSTGDEEHLIEHYDYDDDDEESGEGADDERDEDEFSGDALEPCVDMEPSSASMSRSDLEQRDVFSGSEFSTGPCSTCDSVSGSCSTCRPPSDSDSDADTIRHEEEQRRIEEERPEEQSSPERTMQPEKEASSSRESSESRSETPLAPPSPGERRHINEAACKSPSPAKSPTPSTSYATAPPPPPPQAAPPMANLFSEDEDEEEDAGADIITEEECRRRINKFCDLLSEKAMLREVRSRKYFKGRSDSEHDYNDPEVVNNGSVHLAGNLEDRIFWSQNLPLKNRVRVRDDRYSSSSSSDEDDYAPRRRKPRRRKGDRARKHDRKDESITPPEPRVDPLDALMSPASPPSESPPKDSPHALPAPPRRYSSSDDSDDAQRPGPSTAFYASRRWHDDDPDQREIGRGGGEDPDALCPPTDDDRPPVVALKDETEAESEIEAELELKYEPELKCEPEPEAMEATEGQRVTRSMSRSRSPSRSRSVSVAFAPAARSESRRVSFAEEHSSPVPCGSASEAGSVPSEHTDTAVASTSQERGRVESEDVPSSVDKWPTDEATTAEAEEGKNEPNPERAKEEAEADGDDSDESDSSSVSEEPPAKKYVFWMTAGLAQACRHDRCENLVLLENTTAPSVMYRLGSSTDAKNSEYYRAVRLRRFNRWLELRRHGRETSANSHAEAETEDVASVFMAEMLENRRRKNANMEKELSRRTLLDAVAEATRPPSPTAASIAAEMDAVD